MPASEKLIAFIEKGVFSWEEIARILISRQSDDELQDIIDDYFWDMTDEYRTEYDF